MLISFSPFLNRTNSIPLLFFHMSCFPRHLLFLLQTFWSLIFRISSKCHVRNWTEYSNWGFLDTEYKTPVCTSLNEMYPFHLWSVFHLWSGLISWILPGSTSCLCSYSSFRRRFLSCSCSWFLSIPFLALYFIEMLLVALLPPFNAIGLYSNQVLSEVCNIFNHNFSMKILKSLMTALNRTRLIHSWKYSP